MSRHYFHIRWFAVVALLMPVQLMALDKADLIKAALIYNFTKTIEWPGDKAISKQSSVDICTIGGGMQGAGVVFDKASAAGKTKFNLVQESNAGSAASHCHIVFIASGSADLAAEFAGKPILTVSDVPGFAKQGGMIGFVEQDGKVKFEVNSGAISKAGMRVDAQLLEIALSVIR